MASEIRPRELRGAELSDADVVRRVVAGDAGVFEVLMRRHNPRVYRVARAVLADEPTGNLDPTTAAEVHALLEDLNSRFAMTLVIVTHNERLEALADRTLRLEAGHLEG